jgi:Ca2+-transporting ATPase
VIVFVVFILGFLRGLETVDMLLTALSLAVAAIPEGLPAAVTISLSIGVRKMAKQHALVRRLSSVETLGSAQVICTDKTGTLTQSEMTVKKLFVDGQIHDISGVGYEPHGVIASTSPSLEKALQIGVLCNTANVLNEEGRWICAGDPTECALLTVGYKGGVYQEALSRNFPIYDEIPFDSDRKMMSVVIEENGKKVFYIKGAPDILLDRSSMMLVDGHEVPIDGQLFEEVNEQLAREAYRVLGVAYQPDAQKGEEEGLVFVGLFAMIDPPRPEVKQAIAQCQQAGIQALMVTGDHKATAEAIAKELGIDCKRAVTGKELDQLSNEEIRNVTVFSRTSATHKLRIIQAFQEQDVVTAMTGDGVNDAPAVKAADIGIAMGMTGTDVTKESSDMIILDDNFASIVQAVKQGREIYDNIVKFVSYLLSSNIAEVLVIFIAMLLGMKGPDGTAFIPLLPVQLLWMNLVTDGFPAISLALDSIDPKAMSRCPRPRGEEILNRRFSLFIISISVLVTAGAVAACFWGLQKGVAFAQTMTFTTLIVLELIRAQMIRCQYRLSLFSNRYLLAALASSLLLQLAVVYISPIQAIFGTVPLDLKDWGCIAGISFALWWLGLAVTKLFYRKP